MAQVKVDKKVTAGMTKKQRRDFVREAARLERERAARERRVRRVVGWTLGSVAAVAVAAIVTVLSVNAIRAGQAGPANMASDGLQLTGESGGSTMNPTMTDALAAGELPVRNASAVASTGALDIEVYLDPTKKDAATFWSTNGSTLESFVKEGAASLELHPVALSDSDSDAVAAVAAFGCIADHDPSAASAMWDAMLQVSIAGLDSGTSLRATDLQEAASKAGATDQPATDCIKDGGFSSWAKAASARARASVPYATAKTAVAEAPVVVAAGQVYTGKLDDAAAFTSFLSDAYEKAVPAPSPTPTPAPTSTPAPAPTPAG